MTYFHKLSIKFRVQMPMRWYKSIKSILNGEPEIWLSYLRGQQLENLTYLTENKPRYRGLPLNTLKFFYFVVRKWRPFSSHGIGKPGCYLVFVGTKNQIDSLTPTIEALSERNVYITTIVTKKLFHKKEQKESYEPLAFNSMDILKAIILIIIRGPFLYRELKKLHPNAANWWFSDFCLIYVYLVYFQRILSKARPRFVIIANDHSTINRCILAIAHNLEVETVYLQHASVSTLFPALRVNYAFLDGQCALDIYKKNERNQPNFERQVPIPDIFLSGQKKLIINSRKKVSKNLGVALNPLDDIEAAIDFINQLADIGYDVIIRWHPGQVQDDIKKINNIFQTNSKVILNNPKNSHIGEFLSCINWLIAGNSSIHLEAALMSIPSIYYELTPSSIPDYYGYVKNGLAIKVNSIDEINSLVKENVNIPDSTDSIRYYSSTYQTVWEGQEGELVAEILYSIAEGAKLPMEPIKLF